MLKENSNLLVPAEWRPITASWSWCKPKTFHITHNNFEAIQSMMKGHFKQWVWCVLTEAMDDSYRCERFSRCVYYSSFICEASNIFNLRIISILALNIFSRHFQVANLNISKVKIFVLIQIILIVFQIKYFELRQVLVIRHGLGNVIMEVTLPLSICQNLLLRDKLHWYYN